MWPAFLYSHQIKNNTTISFNSGLRTTYNSGATPITVFFNLWGQKKVQKRNGEDESYSIWQSNTFRAEEGSKSGEEEAPPYPTVSGFLPHPLDSRGFASKQEHTWRARPTGPQTTSCSTYTQSYQALEEGVRAQGKQHCRKDQSQWTV